MANNLLDPTQTDGEEKSSFEPERNASQKDYDDKFNRITNSPENKAFSDQVNTGLRGEFPYSPDGDRRYLAAQEAGARKKPRASEEASLYAIHGNEDAQSSGGKTSRFKGFMSNNKTKGGLLGGGVVGLLIAGFIGVQPFQILHVAKLFEGIGLNQNNETQDSSVRRMYYFMKGERHKSNLGPVAYKIAEKRMGQLKDMGIEFVFETENGKPRGSLQSVKVNPNTAEGKRIMAAAEAASPGSVNTSNGDIQINTRGRDRFKVGRAVSREAMSISNKKGISGAVSKRRFIKLFGANFRPMNIVKAAGEEVVDYRKRRAAEKSKEHKSTNSKKGVLGSGSAGNDADGNPLPDTESNGTRDQIAGEISDITNDADPLSRKAKIKTKVSNLMKSGGGAGGAMLVVAATCAARDMGEGIENYKMLNVVTPAINMYWDIVATGSQIMAGQEVTADEVGAIMEQFYDEETQTAITAAAPLVQSYGGEGGVEINQATKDQLIGSFSGEKPPFFEFIDNLPRVVGIACDANNWFGNLPIVKQIGEITSSATNYVAQGVSGKSLDEWMMDLIAVLSGDAIDTVAAGAERGNILYYGAVFTKTADAIATGGGKLTTTQSMEWKRHQEDIRLAEIRQKSFAARLFDMRDSDSAVGATLARSPILTPSSIANSMKSQPTFAFFSPIQSLSTAFTGQTYAQELQRYDSGIPEYGHPVSLLENERYEDFYANLERFEENDYEKLKEADEKWGACFGNPIDPNNGKINDKSIEGNEEVYKKASEANCPAGDQDFQDYQMYILDNITIKSLACYEGIDDSMCTEVGFSNASGSTPSPTTATVPEGVVSEADTAVIESCPGGARIHKSILAQAEALCQAAAQDGEVLAISDAFRSYESQILLRQRNCGPTDYDIYQKPSGQCSPPTAIPGRSNHEKGVAIDFSNMCYPNANCPPGTNSRYDWLVKNAATYGFYKLSSEAWHWSIDGS